MARRMAASFDLRSRPTGTVGVQCSREEIETRPPRGGSLAQGDVFEYCESFVWKLQYGLSAIENQVIIRSTKYPYRSQCIVEELYSYCSFAEPKTETP